MTGTSVAPSRCGEQRVGPPPGQQAASKKRNNANAMACANQPAGMKSQRTIQNAITSSHTMQPGSALPR